MYALSQETDNMGEPQWSYFGYTAKNVDIKFSVES